ncbi:heterokaryon incompatibility protein [Colletotrichum gloeosporioides Cg-14]|uniref:Heterokaryon incompatibility protein n=1 Tax=Colletotrichum gloeosporioides (strain Cg-14) TaxID=1237896 RepID=T0MD27_COLGC|nr:heterokaryon incompatibility protein [Colletotrichum gloeosporioides Cg-14]
MLEHEGPPVLPTRLVMLHDGRPQGDLGPWETLDVRLVETSSIAQTFDDDVRYVALSHCWGSPDVAARMLQTTTETIGAFSQSIPWGDLTKTFQDAMLVTKRLGIRYIWIDSLCIVQDDARDWAVEASRMASVYANAYLTISAMGATDGHQGLYINTGSKPILRRGVHEIKLPGLEYPIYVRSNEFHESAISDPDLKPIEMPLLHRGWAFQERILSPFVLHFTESELIFEDGRGRSSCECKELDHYISGTPDRDWLFRTGDSSLDHMSWYGIVEEYASRLLTSEADRLPALSGIATTFERQLPALGSYLAGIWETDILGGLHWTMIGTVQPRLQPTLARGTLLSAPPTWSWASVGSSNISWAEYDVPDCSLVDIISATCFPLTLDDKGMVAGGRITLRGRLCLATLDLSPHSSTTNAERYHYITLAGESLANHEPPTFWPDVKLCSGGKQLPTVYFLPLSLRQFNFFEWDLFGLVLCRETEEVTATNRGEHSSKDTATFSRVGCAAMKIDSYVPLQFMDTPEAAPWFVEWRDTFFHNFGQEQVLAIV